jgi:hypothetical protein
MFKGKVVKCGEKNIYRERCLKEKWLNVDKAIAYRNIFKHSKRPLT